MKEIGERLREARESIGISIDEVSEDLELDQEQIINVENGNVDAFKDIFNLKYFIRDYAKYLGLDKEEMVDDFNEYLFDYTSKLSLEDIKKEVSLKDDGPRIQSPYTLESKDEKKRLMLTYIIMGLLLVVIGYFVVTMIIGNNDDINDQIVMRDVKWIYQINWQYLEYL